MPQHDADNPIYHSATLTYGSYLKVNELLSLQRPKTGHHDELLFIQAHQVYELWFKQMLHELEAICGFLDADKPLRAAQLFERVFRIQTLLLEQLPLLETMFSVEFAKFRDALRPASGFQSVQFRKIEFWCGNKNPKFLALVGEDDAAKAEMATYLARPTPYDHLLWHLSREDGNIFRVPDAFKKGVRDTSLPHDDEPTLVDALEILYRIHDDAQKAGATERYYPQFRVAEHLVEFDERFQIWRFHHVKMVERMIGSMGGTGGSSGAKYLASTLMKPFWPDLWAVRGRLGGGTYDSHQTPASEAHKPGPSGPG